MTQINPYLTFDGQCAEVMSFYQACLGGTLTLQTVAESPMAAQWPARVQQHVLHASLVKDGLVLLGSDMSGPDGLKPGTTIRLSLSCDTAQELNTCYANLSEGGNAIREPHEFFGGIIGMLKDKYGQTWMFYHDNSSK